MRKYSDYEKEKIKQLLEMDKKNDLGIGRYIIEIALEDRMIEFDDERKSVTLHTLSKDDGFITELISLISLFDELERNRMIFTHQGQGYNNYSLFSKNLTFDSTCKKVKNIKTGEVIQQMVNRKLNTDIYDTLRSFFNKYVYVTPALKNFVNKGFISHEDEELREARKQTKWAISAFIVAIFALIVSVIIPLTVTNDVHLVNSQEDMLNTILKTDEAIQNELTELSSLVSQISGVCGSRKLEAADPKKKIR